MNMTPEEICREYRQAKHKDKYIQILADMNLCKPQDILAILSDKGEISGASAKQDRPKRAKPAPMPEEVVNDLIKLVEQGYSNTEIAERLGLTADQVSKKKWYLKNSGHIFKEPVKAKPAAEHEEEAVYTKPLDSPMPTAKSSTSRFLDVLTVLVNMQGVDIVSMSVKLADSEGKLCQLQMRVNKGVGENGKDK